MVHPFALWIAGWRSRAQAVLRAYEIGISHLEIDKKCG
jgi:hypothetical protein